MKFLNTRARKGQITEKKNGENGSLVTEICVSISVTAYFHQCVFGLWRKAIIESRTVTRRDGDTSDRTVERPTVARSLEERFFNER